jgi:hypothetical protein
MTLRNAIKQKWKRVDLENLIWINGVIHDALNEICESNFKRPDNSAILELSVICALEGFYTKFVKLRSFFGYKGPQ